MARMTDEERFKFNSLRQNFAAQISFFDEVHLSGDPENCVLINNGDHLLFADGAMRESRVQLGTPMQEPPEDPVKLAKYVLLFTETKLHLAREEFQNLKSALSHRCSLIQKQGNCNKPWKPPTAEDIHQLKLLQIKVNKWQKKFVDAKKQLEAATPQHIKERDKFCEQNRQSAAAALKEITEIEV